MYRADSLYDIDLSKLTDKGIKGIILDIDNTLVPHDAPADERAKGLVDKLKEMGFKLYIVSNNHEPRAKSFSEAVNVPYSYEAHKPSPKKMLEAVERMGLKKSECIAVGDQIFTDMWGAKNAGIEAILTEPLDKASDTALIKLKRLLEIPFKLLQTKRF
ncbi:MAG: YqeG family HAD IIIA-type phosphatase [Eubacteriales bacterium]|nr:YqeG family HAD IIIA-type phosphatase [Eubacteriales bacterium]